MKYLILLLALVLLIIACIQAKGAVSESEVIKCEVEVKTYIEPLPLQNERIGVDVVYEDLSRKSALDVKEKCTIQE
jgi:hypothetical protein